MVFYQSTTKVNQKRKHNMSKTKTSSTQQTIMITKMVMRTAYFSDIFRNHGLLLHHFFFLFFKLLQKHFKENGSEKTTTCNGIQTVVDSFKLQNLDEKTILVAEKMNTITSSSSFFFLFLPLKKNLEIFN